MGWIVIITVFELFINVLFLYSFWCSYFTFLFKIVLTFCWPFHLYCFFLVDVTNIYWKNTSNKFQVQHGKGAFSLAFIITMLKGYTKKSVYSFPIVSNWDVETVLIKRKISLIYPFTSLAAKKYFNS